jgi:hypothetical protein
VFAAAANLWHSSTAAVWVARRSQVCRHNYTCVGKLACRSGVAVAVALVLLSRLHNGLLLPSRPSNRQAAGLLQCHSGFAMLLAGVNANNQTRVLIGGLGQLCRGKLWQSRWHYSNCVTM